VPEGNRLRCLISVITDVGGWYMSSSYFADMSDDEREM
jgi:hypothetical protein